MRTLFNWLNGRTTLVVLLTLLGLPLATTAQIVHDRVYGTRAGEERLNTMLPLRQGGYLLVGTQYLRAQPVRPYGVYVLRLNGVGDTISTKRHLIPGCFGPVLYDAAEGGTGGILGVGVFGTPTGVGSGALLVMFNSQGDTLWTKKVVSPSDDSYYRVEALPGGDFLVAGRLSGFGTLQRLTPQGAVVWQRLLSYDAGTIGSLLDMFPVAGVAGQYWTLVGNATVGNPGNPFAYKYVRFDANGVLGVEVPGLPGPLPRARITAGTGYLTVNADQLSTPAKVIR